jgi:two-component system response regulator AtoC
MVTPALCLIVVQGQDLGARLAVEGTARIVGRARNADLPLTDLAVSRRHLEVKLEGERIAIAICEGAAPFLVGDEERERATIALGDKIIVGNTVLSAARNDVTTAGRAEIERTDVRTLLGGPAVDVRGLAAVFALAEALDAADNREGAEIALAAWAKKHAHATSVAVIGSDGAADAADQPAQIAVQQGPTKTACIVTVPASPSVLVFHLGIATEAIDESLQRLLVVASRVAASSLAHRRALDAALEDQAVLRRQAVGSAQAFLGSSPSADQVARLIPRLAVSDSSALLLGETGSGKTFVARLIHEAGPRAKEPLRVINCAAIPENLVESELFGHERGAFTGAVAARAGAFEAAGRGTVLLDEVGELPLASQAKLLRVLEDKRFERVGSNRLLPMEARVLAATNRDLQAMVEAGTFRRDLYFRISVVSLRIPALRERGEDVVLLARQVLADLATTASRRVHDFSPAALRSIRAYPWPGNVRELRNAIEHALVLGDGSIIEPGDLPESIRGAPPPTNGPDDPSLLRLPANLEWIEGRAIEAALKATGGNRTKAAAILGINRVTLYKKLKEEPKGE